MAVRSTTSRAMGDLLLRGWAMLAENCPDCAVPLMRDPSTQRCDCVNCDASFLNGQRVGQPAGAPAHPAGPAQPSPAPADHQAADQAPEPAAPPMAPVPLRPRARPQEERDREEATAAAIGAKLLAGWALLDATCPMCQTPLVRQRGGQQMWCCGCEMWVLTPEQAAAQGLRVGGQSAPAPDTPAPASPKHALGQDASPQEAPHVAVLAPDAADLSASAEGQPAETARGPQAAHPVAAGRAAIVAAVAAEPTPKASILGLSTNASASVKDLETVVTYQLHLLNAEMNKTPSAVGHDGLLQHLRIAEQCVSVLARVQQLRLAAQPGAS